MVWVATAVVAGTALFGAISSRKGAKDAAKSADRATDALAEISLKELEFAQQQYDEWKETYGPIEDNLAEYYNELTPELRATQGLEAFEREKDFALEGLRVSLEQRGIATSGIAGQIETEIAITSAQERARIRADAPMNVAKEKLGFLQVGLGQNPTNTLSSALAGQTGTAAANARAALTNSTAASRAASEAVGAAVEPVVDLATQLVDVFKSKRKSGGTG